MSHPDLFACRVCPIQVVVRAFVSETLAGNKPAPITKGDPSHEDLMKLPPPFINVLAMWLMEKVGLLGSDSLSSMPDKVTFCQALRHTARGCCQTQACRSQELF